MDPPVEVDPQQHHGRRRHQHLGQVHQVPPEEGGYSWFSSTQSHVLKTFFSEGETEGEPFQRLREGAHNCFGFSRGVGVKLVYVDTFTVVRKSID